MTPFVDNAKVQTVSAWQKSKLSWCDYFNWGHFDKVDQSDYRKITIIHSKKVGCCQQKCTHVPFEVQTSHYFVYKKLCLYLYTDPLSNYEKDCVNQAALSIISWFRACLNGSRKTHSRWRNPPRSWSNCLYDLLRLVTQSAVLQNPLSQVPIFPCKCFRV